MIPIDTPLMKKEEVFFHYLLRFMISIDTLKLYIRD